MSNPDLLHENYIESEAIGQAMTTVFALGIVVGLAIAAVAWKVMT